MISSSADDLGAMTQAGVEQDVDAAVTAATNAANTSVDAGAAEIFMRNKTIT